MRILFICHRLPFPPNRGGKIRPFHMIRHLGEKHSVGVATLAESEKELEDGVRLKDHCTEVIAEVVPKSVRWLQAWNALFTRTPSSVAYFWSSRFHDRVQHAITSHRLDLIWVHCAFVAHYALSAPHLFKVLDYGDLDSAKWFDYSHWKPWPVSWGYCLEANKLRRHERQLTTRFDHCTVTAPGELEEFKKLSTSVPCTLIPNGVDGMFFKGDSSRATSAHVIIFVGRMDYFPNIDGILHFVKRVFPIIRKTIPDAELRIVGSNPTSSIRDLAGVPGVNVTGHVSDIRPYLSAASVAVVPLRIARGTQNKILESMAMGVPVVATSQAAQGVQAIAGDHLLVADEPESFAGAIIRLLDSELLRKKISAAAQRQIESAHSWGASMRILDNVLNNIGSASLDESAVRG